MSDTVTVPVEKIKVVGELLRDKTKPLKQRFRALFTLKNIGGRDAIDCICSAFVDDSALLKHELAYCLGQMRDPYAVPTLAKILDDDRQETIVRHEAGEALGAIGKPEVLPFLEKHRNSSVQEISETCDLAIRKINDSELHGGRSGDSAVVDPAPAASGDISVADLRLILLDDGQPLYERYGAMFALRNIGNSEAVLALSEGLFCGSSLFRHEVAFVLGQLQNKISVKRLIECLKDLSENEMVRHECAEALGAVATDECRRILGEYLFDDKRVVRESCQVALDMCDYENSDSFQYANSLS